MEFCLFSKYKHKFRPLMFKQAKQLNQVNYLMQIAIMHSLQNFSLSLSHYFNPRSDRYNNIPTTTYWSFFSYRINNISINF